jgi:hypothetical protein
MNHPRAQQIYPRGLAAAEAASGESVFDRDFQQDLGVPSDVINALYDILGNYPRKNVLPYFYQFSLTTALGTALAANGTGRAVIRVSADASFVTNYIMGSSTGEYLILFRTDSSDRQLMNDPAHSATVVGTAERPLILPKPLLMGPSTSVSFELTNLTADVNEIYLTLGGFKVYRRQYAMAG